MGLLKTFILIKLTIVTAVILYNFLNPTTVPKVEDEFWGPKSEEGKPEDTSVRDFKIDISEKILTDLKSRLKFEIGSNKLTPPLEGIGFEYGMNTKFLPKILDHWLNKYDWRAREKLLNTYPQFLTKIGGLDIHFQHIKGSKSKRFYKKTLPLLILHGWPGSIVEYQKMIPMLTDPKNSEYNFELIIPSLPGYGFSQEASQPGLDTVGMANIFLRLMKRLGHEKFYVMGSDWGGFIVTDMSTLYPDNILGAHSSLCASMHPLNFPRMMLVAFFPSIFTEKRVSDLILPLTNLYSFIIRESGYLHLQATKPDTVGVGLSQSPSGLAAYLLEKFSVWTNRRWIDREDGGVLENFNLDELLDNIMIYWVTNSITTSMRLYAEAFSSTKKTNLDWVPTSVPFACLMQPDDIAVQPEFALQDKFKNLTQYTLLPKGGHFSALEVPDLVAEDAKKFFNGLQ